jgi:hypothetical protein
MSRRKLLDALNLVLVRSGLKSEDGEKRQGRKVTAHTSIVTRRDCDTAAVTMVEHMRAIAWLLRVFCYIFHTILSLAFLGLGGVAVMSDVHDMKLETLPWQGTELNHWLIGLGIAGLLSVLLAITGKVRFLLPLWSIFVLGLLLKGVFLTPGVTFSGRDDFRDWLWLIGAAALALLGSLTLLGKRRV